MKQVSVDKCMGEGCVCHEALVPLPRKGIRGVTINEAGAAFAHLGSIIGGRPPAAGGAGAMITMSGPITSMGNAVREAALRDQQARSALLERTWLQ